MRKGGNLQLNGSYSKKKEALSTGAERKNERWKAKTN